MTLCRTSFLVAFLLLFAASSKATTCVAIANGNWSSPSTWSCGRVPASNDTMWIPVGFTVQVDINSPTYANMLIIIDGNLFFDVGQKISICPGGVYISPTGSMGGGNPGSKLNICGTTMWNGPEVIGGPVTFGTVVLPVELVEYSGELNSNGEVAISWSTATETNNSHFTIERSTNGLTFEEIGRVVGHGNSSQMLDYTYFDLAPVAGTNYYRLKQTDYNGRYEYVGIVAVDVVKDASGCMLTVFPNPCQGSCTVSFADCPGDNTGDITLQVIDVTGQIVSEQIPQRSVGGGFTAQLDPENNLKPGVYIIRAVSSKKSYSQNAVIK